MSQMSCGSGHGALGLRRKERCGLRSAHGGVWEGTGKEGRNVRRSRHFLIHYVSGADRGRVETGNAECGIGGNGGGGLTVLMRGFWPERCKHKT